MKKGPERPWAKMRVKEEQIYFFFFHTQISFWMYLDLSAEKNSGKSEDLKRLKSVGFWGILSINTVFGKKNQQQINKR